MRAARDDAGRRASKPKAKLQRGRCVVRRERLREPAVARAKNTLTTAEYTRLGRNTHAREAEQLTKTLITHQLAARHSSSHAVHQDTLRVHCVHTVEVAFARCACVQPPQLTKLAGSKSCYLARAQFFVCTPSSTSPVRWAQKLLPRLARSPTTRNAPEVLGTLELTTLLVRGPHRRRCTEAGYVLTKCEARQPSRRCLGCVLPPQVSLP